MNKLYKRWRNTYDGYDLNPSTDFFMSSLLNYAVKIKRANGNQSDAALQLAVFHSAGLIKLTNIYSMLGPVQPGNLLSLLGWPTVVHEWRCYITSVLSDGTIVSCVSVHMRE
jgi:hypothetical protein